MYYFNRRVPKHAVESYGPYIRQALSKCPEEAAAFSKRLSEVLEGSWIGITETKPVNIEAVIQSFKPQSSLLSQIAEEYLTLRGINQKPSRIAMAVFISLAGDRDVSHYTREDAKLFVRHLEMKGNKTATIRRRINSLSAIVNYAYSELDLNKRNPFTKLIIKNEGDDVSKRGTFEHEQLLLGYKKALASGSQIKLLMPLLGETGCRLAEIVGLELQDIDMEQEIIRIQPNSIRRLKTRNSKRSVPLVGYAKLAMKHALHSSDSRYLFPRYIKEGKCKATHASNALNKWLKKDFDGMTAHCLRHTFRDRLRAAECPVEVIDELGGWSTASTVGSRYGHGHQFATKLKWVKLIGLG